MSENHFQRDGRWFSIWCGIDLKQWLLGIRFNSDERFSLGLGFGPLYIGVGGYDR